MFGVGKMMGSRPPSVVGPSATGYDIYNLSEVRVTKSVVDTTPSGLAFNNDGSKIFIVGSGGDSIYEYNLSTSFDLSTISAVQVIESVATEDTNPEGIAFNDDGTKIFMIGRSSASIHEYDLGTAFDLSTISAVQQTKSIATEDDTPRGITFNDDGSKIYMVGSENDDIHQYNLSTSYDLSTMSGVQQTESVSIEDGVPQGIVFNGDGSKIYMVGSGGDSIYEYNLGTPYEISTMSTVQVSRSVKSEDGNPREIAFNNDGFKVFLVGATNDSIYEYDLIGPPVGYKLDNLSDAQVTKSVTTEDVLPEGMVFNNDGSKVFVIGRENDSFYEYNLSTPYDLLTISAVQQTKSVATENTFPRGMAFNGDGSKIYMVGDQVVGTIYEYNLGTFFDLSTISGVQQIASIAAADTTPRDIVFNNDGSKIYTVGHQNSSMYEYNLSTAYDISTISAVQQTESVSIEDTQPHGMAFNGDGSKVYMVGNSSASMHEYHLGTPFDISTISAVQSTKSISSDDNGPRGMAFNNNGLKVYMVGDQNNSLYEYDL